MRSLVLEVCKNSTESENWRKNQFSFRGNIFLKKQNEILNLFFERSGIEYLPATDRELMKEYSAQIFSFPNFWPVSIIPSMPKSLATIHSFHLQ